MGRAQVRFLLLGWRREIYNTQARFVLWACLMSGVAKLVIFTEQIVSHSKGVTFKVHGDLIREQLRQVPHCIHAVEAPGWMGGWR